MNQERKGIFDFTRGRLEGLPGFQKAVSPVRDVIPLFGVSTYLIETVRTGDGWHGFVEAITAEGTVRLYLPNKVMQAIYRHHDSISKRVRKAGARQASETRAAKRAKEPIESVEDREARVKAEGK